MLFIFGKRVARIARYIDHDHICYPCRAYDREIQVYRPYFHFCLIPVFPIGPREFNIRCRNCGDETRTESIMRKYEKKAKTPWYLYSAWILFVSVTVYWFYWNKNTQKNKMEFVINPAVGDVYTIRQKKNNETIFYFLKIIAFKGDSVIAFHNRLDYGDFVSSLEKNDYFEKDDTLVYKRKTLKEMVQTDEIYSVDRDYGEGTGFNLIK